MHDKEIQYFTEGLHLAMDDFYLDAIHKFNMLVDEFPQSDLADDALYNVGLCYFKLKQFEQAKEIFNLVIINYPEATITALENGNEFGLISAKCFLGIFNCHFIEDNMDNAKEIIETLKTFDQNSYLVLNGKKTTFKEIATTTLNTK